LQIITANVRPMPARQVKTGGKKTTRTGGGSGMGKVQPLKGRHLDFLTAVVRGTEAMPEDTIGSWAAPALRHLILVDALGPDHALARIAELYEMIPDPSFSIRPHPRRRQGAGNPLDGLQRGVGVADLQPGPQRG
jgi:hypothetical protein